MAANPINHSINSAASFEKVTDVINDGGNKHIAALYFYYMTDCLVDLADGLSMKVFSNISRFKDANGAPQIQPFADLRYEYGNNAKFPNKEQRNEIYVQVFGAPAENISDGYSEFSKLRNDLIENSRKLLDSDQNTLTNPLRGKMRVAHMRAAHRAFKQFLVDLHGDALKWSTKNSFYNIANQTAYKILGTPEIVKNVTPSTVSGFDWTFVESQDGQKMVEEIAAYLNYSNEVSFTKQYFGSLHSSALSGAVAIATILDFQENLIGTFDEMAEKCYEWGEALEILSGYLGGGTGQRLASVPRLSSLSSQ